MKNLLETFSPVSLQEWKEKLQVDLKGKTFADLSSRDRNGLRVDPFYNKENGLQEGPAKQDPDWAIVSRIPAGDAGKCNKEALQALNQGASGILFEIAGDVDPATLLKDIDYPYIFLAFDLQQDTPSPEAWKAYFDAVSGDESAQKPFFFYDPIDYQLAGSAADFTGLTAAYPNRLSDFSPFSGLAVDGRRYHNAGANSVTQLAAVLAQGNDYLNALKDAGKLAMAENMHIRMATGTLFFEEIAKLRALRKLVPLIGAAYGITLHVHLHVSAGMLHRTPFDRHNNLLRDTIAGMAAVLGGCDSLEIPAFDARTAQTSSRGDRLSRNQQLIFKEESYLNCVADAAAGSFYLDQRTESLADSAWKTFQRLEAQGGLVENIRSGWLPAEIAKQADSLVESYRSGENVLVGINKFPNPKDPPHKLENSEKESILTVLNLCTHL